jgi:hypothetical protein
VAGKFFGLPEQTSDVCTACVAGKYSGAGASVCTDCAAGKYKATAGVNTACGNKTPKIGVATRAGHTHAHTHTHMMMMAIYCSFRRK